MTLDELQEILHQNPEYARIDDLIKPYYDLMKYVVIFQGISEKDRAKIIQYIEKLAYEVGDQ